MTLSAGNTTRSAKCQWWRSDAGARGCENTAAAAAEQTPRRDGKSGATGKKKIPRHFYRVRTGVVFCPVKLSTDSPKSAASKPFAAASVENNSLILVVFPICVTFLHKTLFLFIFTLPGIWSILIHMCFLAGFFKGCRNDNFHTSYKIITHNNLIMSFPFKLLT